MNFATLKGLTIPEGNVTKITDASGRVLWSAVVAPSTATLKFNCSNNGDSSDAEVTITSTEPFAPMPSIPAYVVTTLKISAGNSGYSDGFVVPIGTTIACSVKGYSKGGYIMLNGTKLEDRKYTYVVRCDATFRIDARSAGYGIIEITEQ